MLKVFEKGFNYSQDGPGNRLVYHLQGCNMHCPWCANPDGIAPDGTLVTDDKYLSERMCPYGAVRGSRLDRNICTGCDEKPCLAKRSRGIRLSCREYAIAEIVDEAVRARPLFFDGGGVTFTGGEPTCQFAELREVLAALREQGIHTALETNGTHPRLPALLPLIDSLMIDCKHHDSDTLREVTGIGAEHIARNLRHIVERGVPAAIRIPLIGGFNASVGDLDGFVRYFTALQAENCTLEILPFHEYGRDKWAACGLPYRMQAGRVPAEMLRQYRNTLAQHIRLIRT